MGPIVTAATHAALPKDVLILQVESASAEDATAAFTSGHLPGAHLVDRDQLTAAPMQDGDGRHPLPAPERFASCLGDAGIGWDRSVLAYDRSSGVDAARLVYLLRLLGQSAALLDGGLDGYSDPLATGPAPIARPVSREPAPWPEALVSADDVVAHITAGGVVVDARDAERFRGEAEPIDPVAGHIPGAVNVPYADNLDRYGLFKAPPKLYARYSPLGVDDRTIAYCGSGVTACHDLLAIEHAGLGMPRLYVGSWSQWSRSGRDIAAGTAG